MRKVKHKIIIGGAIGLIGLAGISWKVWHGQKTNSLNQNASSVQGSNTEQSLSPRIDPNNIPLTLTRPQSRSSGGLSVAPNSAANNLGQLTPNSGNAKNSESNNSSASKALDPATFGEYEKYKDGTSALFGDLQVGTGNEVTPDKKVAVYYRGWLTDGRLFDATGADKDGKLQPFVFTMGARQVIPGWEQGLMGMKVGGVRLVIVPPAVGYGAAGHDPIPANAVLVFQVQLLSVQ